MVFNHWGPPSYKFPDEKRERESKKKERKENQGHNSHKQNNEKYFWAPASNEI